MWPWKRGFESLRSAQRGVVQWLEQLLHAEKIEGSSPSTATSATMGGMDYQSLPPESMTSMVSARIAGLEQEHFGIEINLRDNEAWANLDDLDVQKRMRDWRQRQSEIERSVEALKSWAYELVLIPPRDDQQ